MGVRSLNSLWKWFREEPSRSEAAPPVKKPSEVILCAAIWINDGLKHEAQPLNIKEGFVIAGKTHAQCFSTIEAAMAVRKYSGSDEAKIVLGWEMPISGFLTSKDRFLDRKTAFQLAMLAGQIQNKALVSSEGQLSSADLY